MKTTNSTGAVLTTRRYDAFGNLELGATNGYSFTGREWDSETELYYYRARYYDPKIGRFISEDPLRWREGLNFYTYVRNNPVNLIDPWGWCACSSSSSSSCCEEIRRRKQRIHDFLDVLEGKPASPSAGVGEVSGATTCSGHQPDIDYDMIKRTTSPCLLKCGIQHEERHATQCRRFGAGYLGWKAGAAERAAYMQELGCLIREEREQQCCN